MPATVAVLFSRSVGDEIFPPWLEPTSAVKMPEAVVRPWSHVPSFGGHCCPGVSRPVPADGGSSSFSSGPILPSLFIKLTAFSDAKWGNNPDNRKSTSSYIAFLLDGPVSFKVGLQGLTAQSTMEAELVAATLTMKGAMFCYNMMKELGFGTRFDNVPVYIDKISTLHVAGNHTYSPRVKHVALRFFFVQKLLINSQGRKNQYPLRQDGGSTCSHRYQASQQAQASVPHQTNRRLQSLNRIITGTFPCCFDSRISFK